MDVRFCEGRNHRREAHVRAAGSKDVRFARSSVARVRRAVFSLDNDLHGRRQIGGWQVDGKSLMVRLTQVASETPTKNTYPDLQSHRGSVRHSPGSVNDNGPKDS